MHGTLGSTKLVMLGLEFLGGSWGVVIFFLVVLAGGKVTQDHVTCGLIRCMFAFGCSSQKLKICTKRCGFDCVTFDSMRKLERA